MKNIILGSVLAMAAVTSLSANAAGGALTICAGGVATNGAVVSSGTDFVKVAFTPKCSANVLLSGEDFSATVYRVGSASVKGKSTFNGSSVGGAVGFSAACAASPCTPGEVSTAIAAAPTS